MEIAHFRPLLKGGPCSYRGFVAHLKGVNFTFLRGVLFWTSFFQAQAGCTISVVLNGLHRFFRYFVFLECAFDAAPGRSATFTWIFDREAKRPVNLLVSKLVRAGDYELWQIFVLLLPSLHRVMCIQQCAPKDSTCTYRGFNVYL